MPVIVGVPRSGTTLLRFMLDAHPALAIPPETGFLASAADRARQAGFGRRELFEMVTTFPPDAPAWNDFGVQKEAYWKELQSIEPFSVSDGLRVFYRLYATRHNKPRYGEKTPEYCLHIPGIGSLLPEAHFIHIIRDGRDVALSLHKTWFAPGQDMPTLAAYWQRLIRAAREAGCRAQFYKEVRYEELISQPQPTLEAVCAFIDLEFNSALLRYWERVPSRLAEHRTRRRIDGTVIVNHKQRLAQQKLTTEAPRLDRVFRWKFDLSEQERAEFARVAGKTLEELGYEV